MDIKIYDINGNVVLEASADSSSRWNHEVGVENVVQVNFTTWEFVKFAAGAYIEITGERFKLRREYKPKHVNNRKYSYSMSFYGREHDAQDLLFCRLNQGTEDMESVFQYEGTPMELLEKVVANMNRNSEGYVWKVGSAISAPRQSINFNGVFCWDALGQIAQAFETEWWRDGQYINLTKCEKGNAVPLGYGEGLRTGLQQNEAENAVKYFTRLIPVGSTKNVDKAVYGYERLQLPGKEVYVDVNIEQGLKEHREEAAFAGIYPHRVGVISAVESEERTDAQGRDYTVYFFADSELPFDPDECLLPGKVINVDFVSGELEGKDFEVIWDAAKARFEIINTYPDEDTQLPGGSLVPKAGDEYILWNLAMPVQYYAAAEQEFATAVDKFIDASTTDASTYTAQTDYIALDREGIRLSVGQRVTLLSDRYFDGGSKESRITKISRSLDRLNDATIECRNAVTQSWKSGVDNSLNSIHYSVAKSIEQTMIELLQTGDKDAPSEYNVFSAIRALGTFLRKDREDATNFFTTFKAGLNALRLEVDRHSLFGGDVSSSKFVSGMTGNGWAIQQKRRTNVAGEEENYTVAEVDEMVVRRALKVYEFVVSQMLGENDNRIFSGMMEVDHFEQESGKVYLKTDGGKLYNPFRAGDILIVQQYEGEDIIKNYELVVARCGVGVPTEGTERMDWITFDSFAGGLPEVLIAEGDTLVRADSMTDENRKGVIQVTSVGANAPYIDVLRGMKTDPDNALKVRVGNLDGVRDADFGENQPEGSGVYAQNAYLKGTFVLSSGEDVRTELIAKDGMIKSSVQSLQKDSMTGKTVVYNASFTEGTTGWLTQNAAGFYLSGGLPVFLGESALQSFAKVVATDEYGESRFYMWMLNTTIRQSNDYFELHETMEEGVNIPVVFGVKYKAMSSAMLIVALDGCSDASANACRGVWTGDSVAGNGNVAVETARGAIEFVTIDRAIDKGDVLIVTRGYRLINATKGEEVKYVVWTDAKQAEVRLGEPVNLLAAMSLQKNEKFQDIQVTGLWDGTGDLAISYLGEIGIYAIQLHSEATEVRYATFFEQSDKLISMAAKNFNADGTVKAESEIVVKPEGAGLMTRDATGKVATVGTYEGGVVKLTGEEVQLEGKVTANGNVEITEDGKLKALDGEFSGRVEATSGKIGNFSIDDGLEYIEANENSNYAAAITENGAAFGDTYEDYVGTITRRKSIEINGRFTDKKEDARAMVCRRTVAKDVLGNTFYETPPMVELIDESTLPTPVLKTVGGVIQEGAFLHCYATLKLETEVSPNVLTINYGNKWFIFNSSGSERVVYFPLLSDMLKMLCLENTDAEFAVPLNVTVARYSIYERGVILKFQPADSDSRIIEGQNFLTEMSVTPGATIRFLMRCDQEKGYDALVLQ